MEKLNIVRVDNIKFIQISIMKTIQSESNPESPKCSATPLVHTALGQQTVTGRIQEYPTRVVSMS